MIDSAQSALVSKARSIGFFGAQAIEFSGWNGVNGSAIFLDTLEGRGRTSVGMGGMPSPENPTHHDF